MLQDVFGLFGSIADFFGAIEDFWDDLGDRCEDHWATSWLGTYFHSVANIFGALEFAFDFVDTWATAVVDGILDRVRYNELRQKVKDVSGHLKDIIENPGFWLCWQIGKALGLAWWQRIEWKQLPFYILKIHVRPVWDLWQRPQSTFRGWLSTYAPWLYDLYRDPFRRIREKIGEIMGFSTLETRHPEWWPSILLYRIWPDWYQFNDDPANYIKWKIYAKWPLLLGFFGFPRSWLKQRISDIFEFPVGFWVNPKNSLVEYILDRIEERVGRFADQFGRITEEVLLRQW